MCSCYPSSLPLCRRGRPGCEPPSPRRTTHLRSSAPWMSSPPLASRSASFSRFPPHPTNLPIFQSANLPAYTSLYSLASPAVRPLVLTCGGRNEMVLENCSILGDRYLYACHVSADR